MKCLSVQQPWASLICSGIKDVENRSWRVNEAPGRILIHAGKTQRKVDDLPLFYAVIIDNASINGIMPEIDDMPLGAIIGWADIVGFEEDSDSIWAGDKADHGSEWKWKIGKAGLFKEPIPYRGKQGLFEVPEITEENLPESIEFPELRREDMILHMPISPEIFDTIEEADEFAYYLTEDNQHLFVGREFNIIPTDKIVFYNSVTGDKKEMTVRETCTTEEWEDEENQRIYYDPFGNELVLTTINYEFKDLGRV